MKFTCGCFMVLLMFELSNCGVWEIREISSPGNEAVTTDTSEMEELDTNCLTKLHLSLRGLDIPQLPDDSIANPYIVSLDLSNNNIESISENAFRRLPKLESLDLSGNRIDIAKILFHVNISQLVTLKYHFGSRQQYYDYYNNEDIDLPQFPRLKALDLQGNGQTVKMLNLETVTPQLTHLDLSKSNLETGDVVGHLPLTITHLILDDNIIDFTQMDMLENIEELSINRNIIVKTCVNSYDFHDYGEVCDNDLRRVIINAERWRKMKRLHLSGNNIKEIVTNEMGGQLDLLELLDLSHNAISDINSDFSDLFPNLKNLSLRSNHLRSIPNTLCSMNFLETLDLSNNEVNTFIVDSSCTFENLKNLNLRYNSISTANQINLNIFPSLTDLDLSKNLLRSIPGGWMNAPMLEILRLNDNMFYSFNEIDLSDLPALKELHIKDNPLSLIRTDDMMHIMQNLTIYFKDMPAPESSVVF